MTHTIRGAGLAFFAGALGLLISAADAGEDKAKGGDEAGFTQLFNGKDLTGWKVVPEAAQKAISVKEGEIHVTGNPNGYFHTDKPFKNYVLRFDWKYLKDGNSGLLVHIQEPHKVWPKSVEVQGMQKQAGHIFAIMGAKGQFKTDKGAQQKAIKVGEWNTTEVTSKDGALTAKVNGVEVSTGKGGLTQGTLGLQSEGAPMLYKNIRIKTLD